jgi:DNA-binding transcriptional MerR regulator
MGSPPKLRTGQVAERWGITPQHVASMAREGILPCEMTPLGRLYDAEVIERLTKERRRRRARPDGRIAAPRQTGASGTGRTTP